MNPIDRAIWPWRQIGQKTAGIRGNGADTRGGHVQSFIFAQRLKSRTAARFDLPLQNVNFHSTFADADTKLCALVHDASGGTFHSKTHSPLRHMRKGAARIKSNPHR